MKFQLDTLHEKGWFKSLAAVVTLVIGIITLTSAVMSFFHHAPETAKAGEGSARVTVPAAASDHATDDAFKQELQEKLTNKDAQIVIVAARQNAETAKYARELEAYLGDQGFNNVTVAFTSFPASFRGVEIDRQKNRTFIKVGHR